MTRHESIEREPGVERRIVDVGFPGGVERRSVGRGRARDAMTPAGSGDLPRPRRSSSAHWLAVAAVVGLVCVGSDLSARLATERGRELVRRGIEGAYADRLHGTLRIGSIDAIENTMVRASNVRFADPEGIDVITVENATVDLDLSSLLGGTLRFDEARARGATLVVRSGAVEKTSLEEAFASRDPSSGPGIAIDTGPIRFDATTLKLALGGAEVNVTELEGFVRVARSEGGPRVRFDAIRGRYEGPGARVIGRPLFEASGRLRVRPAGTEARFDVELDMNPRWPIAITIDRGEMHFDLGSDGPPLVVAAMRTASVFVGSLEVTSN